jgi:hypothetical protein
MAPVAAVAVEVVLAAMVGPAEMVGRVARVAPAPAVPAGR